MAVDWTVITVDDVAAACDEFDSGVAVPKRGARTTFLLLNGRRYPAKFIRGLAYRMKTGIELDPSRDYSGGSETVRFFAKLGLVTEHCTRLQEPDVALPDKAPLVSPRERLAEDSQRASVQRRALLRLLLRRFREVRTEAQFDWLVVPGADEMDEAIREVYVALSDLRGHSGFASTGRKLCCDFVVPSRRLIIEYDEHQHFTVQRATALHGYPPTARLSFDRDKWVRQCERIHATGVTPPYRDEQRAFYNSLRDLLALRHGFTMIRLMHGETDWTLRTADEQLDGILKAALPVNATGTTAVERASHTSAPLDAIKRIALISHDYNIRNRFGLIDYSEEFQQINRCCDQEGCDTILYALYTWDLRSPLEKSYQSIFSDLSHVQRITVETGEFFETVREVEIWRRDHTHPLVAHQRFAKSQESADCKLRFMNDLPRRCVSDGLLMICGELNITTLRRSTADFDDPFGFIDALGELDISVILNPIHDYMRRYEMREKRKYYSRNGRTVVSVWNRGRRSESSLPWTVFRDGHERTAAVRRLETDIASRPDVQIGIVDLDAMRL